MDDVTLVWSLKPGALRMCSLALCGPADILQVGTLVMGSPGYQVMMT